MKTIRSPPDFVEEYKLDYGYMGPMLCSAVAKARTQPLTAVTPTAVSLTTNQQQNPTMSSKSLIQSGNFLLLN